MMKTFNYKGWQILRDSFYRYYLFTERNKCEYFDSLEECKKYIDENF